MSRDEVAAGGMHAAGRLRSAAAVWSAGWRAYLSAACLGVVAAGALPPLTVVPLLLVAIPGLLFLVDRAPGWRSAAARGLVFGLFHHMAGLYWVTNAILVMAAEFWWAVPLAVPLLALVLAIFIALPCGAARAVPGGWPRLVVFAGLWVLGDVARQFFLSGLSLEPARQRLGNARHPRAGVHPAGRLGRRARADPSHPALGRQLRPWPYRPARVAWQAYASGPSAVPCGYRAWSRSPASPR